MTPSGKVVKPDRAVVSSVAKTYSPLFLFDKLTTYTDYYYRLPIVSLPTLTTTTDFAS